MRDPVVVATDRGTAEDWDAYVEQHSERDGGSLWRWRQSSKRCSVTTPCTWPRAAAVPSSGVLPLVLFRSRLFGRFVVSLPFLNYGGVVADGRGERSTRWRAPTT